MKQILILTILFSIFLIQIHGVAHATISGVDHQHECSLCETFSHSSDVAPVDIIVEYIPILCEELTSTKGINSFLPNRISFSKCSPRAPPFI
jgi:hypothetical protein